MVFRWLRCKVCVTLWLPPDRRMGGYRLADGVGRLWPMLKTVRVSEGIGRRKLRGGEAR